MGLLTRSGDVYVWRGKYHETAARDAGFEWDRDMRRWVTTNKDTARALWRQSLPPLRDELRPPAPAVRKSTPKNVHERVSPKKPSPPQQRKPRGKWRPCGACQRGDEVTTLPVGGPCMQCGEPVTPNGGAHCPESDDKIELLCGRCCPHCEEWSHERDHSSL